MAMTKTAALGLGTVAVIAIVAGSSKENKPSDEIKEPTQIETLDKKVNQLQESFVVDDTIINRVEKKQALHTIEDSLRMDSIAKTNYEKGLQRVRNNRVF